MRLLRLEETARDPTSMLIEPQLMLLEQRQHRFPLLSRRVLMPRRIAQFGVSAQSHRAASSDQDRRDEDQRGKNPYADPDDGGEAKSH